MKQIKYIILNVTFLIILAIVFVFQVRAFREHSASQWLFLIAIGVIGAISFYLNKRMRKEKWFINLQKRKSR